MANTEWKPHRLDELGFVGRGKSRHRPRNEASLYGGKYPFFQTGDIKAASLHLTEYSQTYSEKGLAQSKLWQPGTLCITIAANIAETAILGIPGCFPDSIVGFVAEPAKADVHFIKYFIDTLKLRMQSASRGTTQDNLSVDKLLTFDFRIPPLQIQQRIAGILAAYDAMMENNQRRIRILEDITRTLYREWFVRFRFPGHERLKDTGFSLDDIPRGWEVKPLVELTSFLSRGLSPSYDDNGESVVFNQKCIRDQRLNLEPARRQGRAIPPDRRIRFGDVLINSTGVGTLGRVAQVCEELTLCTVDSHVTIVRPSGDTDVDFFGCTLFGQQQTFERLGIGATGQTELSRTAIANVEVVVPPLSLQRRFGEVVRPIRAATMVLAVQIQNLRRTRDLLLPRLLSGQLNIGEA